MTQCIDIVNNLLKSIDHLNTELIINMIDVNVKYEDVCIKPNLTFDRYFLSLKAKWEEIINDYVRKPDKCSGNIDKFLFVQEVINMNSNKIDPNTMDDLEKRITDKILNRALTLIDGTDTLFVMDIDMITSLYNLAKILSENCQCQIIDIFTYAINGYKHCYSKKIQGLNKDQALNVINKDYEYIKNLIINYGKNNSIELTMNKNNIFNFSIEKEMNNLIPDSLGKMKKFFVTVITIYFNKLHPIIWTQIFRAMMNNLFEQCPMTNDDFFSFVSKYVLLNSGPFILKILQMIRPILSDELLNKYNLTKLSYPKLEIHQIDIILKHILIDYDMSVITDNKSASVGHVCIGHNAKNLKDRFVIKIIKPLAIAQSCWEYSILKDVFRHGSCEDTFIKNTLKSNGAEMNVENEINNLNRSHEMYTSDYKSEFSLNVDACVTTIKHKQGIIKPGIWFALAMTLAPGSPLSFFIENDLLKNDTKMRANLHRCLDVLVSRFFYTLINRGFYHGDLHSGNIFYSYKRKQITLIDFGAMGDINLFSGDTSTNDLINVIIMSTFYNYDDMLDLISDILNSKCKDDPDSFIDKNSTVYIKFKNELIVHKVRNIINADIEEEKNSIYMRDISSDRRLSDENSNNDHIQNDYLHKNENDIEQKNLQTNQPSIYDHLESILEPNEIFIEEKDTLPVFTEIIDNSESITFAGIMQLIIGFYAKTGVNIAVKFSEFNELQKAYALLLGVLAKTGYGSYRMSQAIKKGILNWRQLSKLVHIKTTYSALHDYKTQAFKYKNLKNYILSEKNKYRY